MFIKKYTGIIILLIFAALSLSSGCKKSSSDNSPTAPQTSAGALVGTWVMTNMAVVNTDSTTTSYTPEEAGLSIKMIFRADNSAEITTTDSSGTSTESGTYTFANNIITLKNTAGQTQSFPVTINGNTLTARLDITTGTALTHAIVTFTKQQ